MLLLPAPLAEPVDGAAVVEGVGGAVDEPLTIMLLMLLGAAADEDGAAEPLAED